MRSFSRPASRFSAFRLRIRESRMKSNISPATMNIINRTFLLCDGEWQNAPNSTGRTENKRIRFFLLLSRNISFVRSFTNYPARREDCDQVPPVYKTIFQTITQSFLHRRYTLGTFYPQAYFKINFGGRLTFYMRGLHPF